MDEWCRFFFLRTVDASVPEASERLGEPGLLRVLDEFDFLIPPSRSDAGYFSLRPDGVFAPDEIADLPKSSSALRLACFSASSFSRSSSESD